MYRFVKLLIISSILLGCFNLFAGTVTNTSSYVYTGNVNFTSPTNPPQYLGTNIITQAALDTAISASNEALRIYTTNYIGNAVTNVSTNGLASVIYVDNATNNIRAITNDLASTIYVANAITNNIITTNGLWSLIDGTNYVGNAVTNVSTNGLASTIYLTNYVSQAVTNISTNGLASTIYVDSATNTIGWLTNGLASIPYVDDATNAAVTTATNLAYQSMTGFVARAVTNGSGGGSATTQTYSTNHVAVAGNTANYLFPLNTNACEIPHIWAWCANTNNADFSGTIWTWDQNNYQVGPGVNRFAARFQCTDMTNESFSVATNILKVRDASSFNNDDIVAIFPHGVTNAPTEYAVVTNRNANFLYLRHNTTGDYSATSGRVHRVVRFDGLDWYHNRGASNAIPMTLEFSVAITNVISVIVNEVDN